MMSGWRARAALAAMFAMVLALPLAGQEKGITEQLLDLLVEAVKAEDAELDKVESQLQEVDEKIKKFEECKALFEAGGEATGSKLGGLAAKVAIKAKCGATSVDGYLKDRQKILEGPEKVALGIIKLKSKDYGALKERVGGFLGGRRDGFSSAELAALDSRKSALSGALRVSVAAAPGGGGGGAPMRSGRGVRSHNFSSPNYAWEYIGNMFEITYLSGAFMFEKPYQPGQWTKWTLTREYDVVEGDEPVPPEKSEFERAFLGKSEDGGEWWRTTQIDWYLGEDDKQVADTVVLEGLFKGANEYVRQLVRMRGKFPGQEAQELMVPQAFAMLSLLAAFPFKPTEESIKGATVGTEKVSGFDARHVKFGGSDGTMEWWISDTAPGGWVRFRHTEPTDPSVKKPGFYVMEMVQSGSGAKSALGVM